MKTTTFQIISLTEQSFLVVILSTEMIDYYWDTLQFELSKYKVNNAEVYFDFLYRNGLKNRFFKTKLNGVRLVNNSLVKCIATDDCINASEIFFSSNQELIECSVLSSFQKLFFKKKLDKRLQQISCAF